MKDIKTLMIGFLLATCMLLLIGADRNDSQIGKYQAMSANAQMYLLDTTNGEMWLSLYRKYGEGKQQDLG